MSSDEITVHTEPASELWRCSPGQLRIAGFLSAGHGGLGATVKVRVSEGTSLENVQRSLASSVARHEILRTRLVTRPGLQEPVQEVAAVDGGSGVIEVSLQDDLLTLSLPPECADETTLVNLLFELRTDLAAGTATDEPMQHADVAEWQYEVLTQAGQSALTDARDAALSAQLSVGSIATARRVTSGFTPSVVDVGQPVGGASVSTESLLTCWRTLLTRLLGAPAIVAARMDLRTLDVLHGSMGPLSRSMPLPPDSSLDVPGDVATSRTLAALATALADVHAVQLNDEVWPYLFSRVVLPSIDGWVVEDFRVCTEPFVLQLECLETADGSKQLQIAFDCSVVEESLVVVLAEQLGCLIAAVVNGCTTPVAQIDLLTADTRRWVLEEVSGSSLSGPSPDVMQLVQGHARTAPDDVAIVAGDRKITYSALLQEADLVAARLIALGVGPETVVGVLAPRSPEQVVALLGILRAGGAYLPLDPGYPVERLAMMTREAGVRWVLATEPETAALPGVTVLPIAANERLSSVQLPHVDPANLAYVLFTSGSTGQPKGVMVTRGGLAGYVTWAAARYDVASGTGAPVDSPLSFDLTITSLLVPLAAGRAVQLLPEGFGLSRMDSLVSVMQARPRFSLVKITPSTLDSLGQAADVRTMSDATDAFVVGGEQLTYETLAPWREHAPGTRLINEYGPTETVVGCCVYEVLPDDPQTGPVPIGRPVAGAQMYLLDDRMQLVATGHVGQLFIAGPGLARGYHGDPARTAAAFVPHPYADGVGERLYVTGDLARRRPDGQLEFLGRTDQQIKVRGLRIEPAEIDAAAQQHEGVRSSVTVVREIDPGDSRLTTYVVMSGSQGTDDVLERMRSLLPTYMLPSFVVAVDEIPVTTNGKLDAAALPDPIGIQDRSIGHIEPAATEVEAALEQILAGVLGVQRLGVTANFFARGGHSLLVAHATAEIRETLGVSLALRQLFDTPTVRDLAVVVEAAFERVLEDMADDQVRALAEAGGHS